MGPHTPILIVSDSQLAIGLTRYRQRPKAPDTRALAHSVRPLFDKLRARFPLTLILWAPSHRNNPINDAADTAANKGAALSKAGKGLGAEAKEWKIQHGIFAPRPNRSSVQQHLY
jgi:ribonuclease HI